ncbi:MAG: metallophosphoesterase [Bacteroidales bacterium]|nr:metallophosphoesterase [Bacteroidales bacterium]
MKNLFLPLALVFIMYSCKRDDAGQYSFFVAGHTYGAPMADNQGLHPPFTSEFDKLNNDNRLQFGVFTGDIVRNSDTASWDAVDRQLENLHIPVYFCPGNHDTYNRELYESRNGKPYYSFTAGSDLFIVLDGSLDHWNITGDQLEFLITALQQAESGVNNVFVFIHQLIWWDESNIFSSVKLNWPPYTPDTTNYWAVIEPMLQHLSAPVYIFAGDLGASTKASPVMYYPDRNITYIGSGMGSIVADNYIIVTSGPGRTVSFELIAPGNDPHKLGNLEDHLLSGSP